MAASLELGSRFDPCGFRSSEPAGRRVCRFAARRSARDVSLKPCVTLGLCEGPKRPPTGSEPDSVPPSAAEVFIDLASLQGDSRRLPPVMLLRTNRPELTRF